MSNPFSHYEAIGSRLESGVLPFGPTTIFRYRKLIGPVFYTEEVLRGLLTHSGFRKWKRDRRTGRRAPVEGGYWPFHRKHHARMAGK